MDRFGDVGREVDLREGDAQALQFPDEAFDTVVCTLSLCNIPESGLVRAVQWLLEQVTLRIEGEHLLRRPLEHVVAQGFEIECVERLKSGIVERISTRKPA